MQNLESQIHAEDVSDIITQVDLSEWESTTTGAEHISDSVIVSPFDGSIEDEDSFSDDDQPPILETPNDIHLKSNKPSILELYWIEREKLIKHLERRAKKFEKRNKEDYDRARWGKSKPRKPKAPLASKPNRPPTTAAREESRPPLIQSDSVIRESQATEALDTMIASTSAAVMSTAKLASSSTQAPLRQAFVNGARTFATTSRIDTRKPTTKLRRLVREQTKQSNARSLRSTVTLEEATQILRAMSVSSPNATYNLTIDLRQKQKGKDKRHINIRGRVSLPRDPRQSKDVILVFAEYNSESAKLAQQEGVQYVGGDELFEPLLNGEINPTKILATPSILPQVTRRLARFLGPKGLMPTTRRGGVGEGPELVDRIRDAKGALDWIVDANGLVNSLVGRIEFPTYDVEANVRAIVESVKSSVANAAGGGTTKASTDDALLSGSESKKKAANTGITAVELATSVARPLLLKV